jgi:hypothetical protein
VPLRCIDAVALATDLRAPKLRLQQYLGRNGAMQYEGSSATQTPLFIFVGARILAIAATAMLFNPWCMHGLSAANTLRVVSLSV